MAEDINVEMSEDEMKDIELAPSNSGPVGLVREDRKSLENLMWIADNAEQIMSAKDKIRNAILRLTKSGGWTVFKSKNDDPGTAEIGAGEAFRISSVFGVSFVNTIRKKVEGSDKNGSWYRWEVEGDVVFNGNTIRTWGAFGTRDKFFGRENKEWKDTADCNEKDIIQAAIRAQRKEGVKMHFGLHHFPVEDLKLAGVKVDYAGSYTFGSKEGAQTTSPDKISEPQAKRLFAICSTAKKTPEQLKSYIQQNYKIDHTKDIMKKDYETICTWAGKTEAKVEAIEEEYVVQ